MKMHVPPAYRPRSEFLPASLKHKLVEFLRAQNLELLVHVDRGVPAGLECSVDSVIDLGVVFASSSGGFLPFSSCLLANVLLVGTCGLANGLLKRLATGISILVESCPSMNRPGHRE